MKPDFPVRAKVRIGIKGKTAGGKEYPKAVDYFVSDDPEFEDGLKVLRVRFPFASVDDNFSSGMEFWRKNQLACYTKDDGADPIALRVPSLVKPEDVIRGEPKKSGRVPITCTFRACPFFLSKDCKPMGRLVFLIDGDDPAKGVYELDTKSWNSIEALTGFLALAGDPRGRLFELAVRMEQRRTDKFPLLSLTEVQVDDTTTTAPAPALVALRAAVERNNDPQAIRGPLADALDSTNPGWRTNEAFVQRITEVGIVAAATGLLERHGA